MVYFTIYSFFEPFFKKPHATYKKGARYRFFARTKSDTFASRKRQSTQKRRKKTQKATFQAVICAFRDAFLHFLPYRACFFTLLYAPTSTFFHIHAPLIFRLRFLRFIQTSKVQDTARQTLSLLFFLGYTTHTSCFLLFFCCFFSFFEKMRFFRVLTRFFINNFFFPLFKTSVCAF